MVSVVKSIHLISQSAIFTPFKGPTPATSHFNISGFKAKNFENDLKFLLPHYLISDRLNKCCVICTRSI